MTTKQSQPAIAVTGLRKPHPKSGYGLGLFALDEGPNCGGTILSHNGGVQGSGALMISRSTPAVGPWRPR